MTQNRSLQTSEKKESYENRLPKPLAKLRDILFGGSTDLHRVNDRRDEALGLINKLEEEGIKM